MKLKQLLSKDLTKKIIAVMLLLSFALLSAFVFVKPATAPETYAETVRSIDEKKGAVMALTASAATASAIIAAVPGDTTTPIANKIMDISACLLIVVCALVLEKSLLTVMGFLSFKLLIPAACILMSVYVFIRKNSLKTLAIKFIVFALVLVTVIPLCMKVSDLIYDMNKTIIEQTTLQIDETETNDEQSEEPKENQGILEKAGALIGKLLNNIKDSASAAGEYAKQVLNNFIDAIALFIIVYCAIPILIILLVLWFVKFLFGVNIPLPKETPFKSLITKKETSKKPKEEVELLEV